MILRIDPEFQALIPPLTPSQAQSQNLPFYESVYDFLWSDAQALSAFLRKCTVSTPRQVCCICNKYKFISEAHHLFPISELVSIIQQYHLCIDLIFAVGTVNVLKTAWLCPNHHAIYHAYNRRSNIVNMDVIEFIAQASEDEQTRLREFFNLADKHYSDVISAMIRSIGERL